MEEKVMKQKLIEKENSEDNEKLNQLIKELKDQFSEKKRIGLNELK